MLFSKLFRCEFYFSQLILFSQFALPSMRQILHNVNINFSNKQHLEILWRGMPVIELLHIGRNRLRQIDMIMSRYKQKITPSRYLNEQNILM